MLGGRASRERDEVDFLPIHAISRQWAARPLGQASLPFNGLYPVYDLRNLSQLILPFRHRKCYLSDLLTANTAP